MIYRANERGDQLRKIQCLCFTVIIVLCITVTGCKLDSADESAMLYEASEIATEPAEKYGLEFDTEVFLDGNLWHTIRNNSENDYECGGIEVLEILDNDTVVCFAKGLGQGVPCRDNRIGTSSHRI